MTETKGTRELVEAFSAFVEKIKEKLLENLRNSTPDFFEQAVVDLLLALEYGSSGEVVGKTGDGGIDGVIYEDKLGFDRIYVQAKRWGDSVGRPEVQKFYGALQGVSARKGVFITTSEFTGPAREYVKTLPIPIVLIDGLQMAELMYESNVGVQRAGLFEIKELDNEYFSSKKTA